MTYISHLTSDPHSVEIQIVKKPLLPRIYKIAVEIIKCLGKTIKIALNNCITDLGISVYLSLTEKNILNTPLWFNIIQNYARIQLIRRLIS